LDYIGILFLSSYFFQTQRPCLNSKGNLSSL
jgi:hypothetical protein